MPLLLCLKHNTSYQQNSGEKYYISLKIIDFNMRNFKAPISFF